MSNPLDSAEKQTVLVVDDAPDNLTLMNALLRDTYRVKVANSGENALRIVDADPKPDIILLDIMMPGMDGYEVMRQLQDDPILRDIPVIFLTAMTASDDEKVGLDLGAVDYITKPINPAIVLARVRNHLHLKAARDFLRNQSAFLSREVARRTQEVTTMQHVTIRAMASLAESRDNATSKHLRRTQQYVKSLASYLKKYPRFSDELTEENIERLVESAPLHDIGKVGLPDRILLKPGRLDEEEFDTMKSHTTMGRDAIEKAELELGGDLPFLRYAKEIAYSHQEKWDGSGYPQGLIGEQIPVAARLMALADVYDALITRRAYKAPNSHEKAVEIIVEGKGTHFDPDVVDAFVKIHVEFRSIAAQFPDDDADMVAQAERVIRDLPSETIEVKFDPMPD